MVPIKILKDGRIHELSTDAFGQSIIDVCEKHRKENRALAFAFIIYNFENPQISKILNDKNYWNAINTISGKYLSIYYIHSYENTFGEDLLTISDYEQRGLYPIESKNSLDTVLPMLKRYLELDEDVKNPSILFFQVEGNLISDYFIIKLLEEKIEESFLELKDYISSAVERLKMIDPKYYGNIQTIFESLKHGVRSTNLRKVFFKKVQKIPLMFFINLFSGK